MAILNYRPTTMVYEAKREIARLLNMNVDSFQLRMFKKYLIEDKTFAENEYSAEEIIYAVFKKEK